jgi:hypothetical protein
MTIEAAHSAITDAPIAIIREPLDILHYNILTRKIFRCKLIYNYVYTSDVTSVDIPDDFSAPPEVIEIFRKEVLLIARSRLVSWSKSFRLLSSFLYKYTDRHTSTATSTSGIPINIIKSVSRTSASTDEEALGDDSISICNLKTLNGKK